MDEAILDVWDESCFLMSLMNAHFSIMSITYSNTHSGLH